MHDLRVRVREAERRAQFWVMMAKRRGGSEPSRRTRISAKKAKRGLTRIRRRLSGQVLMEELEDL